TISLRIQVQATDGPACNEPGQGDPGIVGGNPRRVCAGGNLDALLEYSSHWRSRFSGNTPISLHEILTLIRHPMLHGDAAAQCSYTVDRSVRNGLCMVEEPVQTLERCVSMNLFEGIESP